MVSRRDVAKLAGVSEATVSRAINNVEPLRKETKERVLNAAATLNYHPNAIAQSFATRKSGNIGVIVPYLPKVNLLSTYYFSEIVGGIGMKLAEHDYNLLLIFQSPHKRKDYIKLFQSQRIDGCIILGSSDVPGEIEEIEKLHQLKLPYCLVNQTFEGHSFNTIAAKHYEGSFEAVSFLIKKGFKRIAFLNGPREYSDSTERLRGYQDALFKFGIKPIPEWIYQGNYSRTSGLQVSIDMCVHMPKIDAVFASNDRMAIGLSQGLSEQGFQVGQDYALIGYDDSDVAELIQPQLSSVKVPLFKMGKLAAEKILNTLLIGQEKSFQERLPVELIERASTQIIKR